MSPKPYLFDCLNLSLDAPICQVWSGPSPGEGVPGTRPKTFNLSCETLLQTLTKAHPLLSDVCRRISPPKMIGTLRCTTAYLPCCPITAVQSRRETHVRAKLTVSRTVRVGMCSSTCGSNSGPVVYRGVSDSSKNPSKQGTFGT